ncbi:MAG: PKD domain-containing protein [Candidatus Anammoxibacter sp.]
MKTRTVLIMGMFFLFKKADMINSGAMKKALAAALVALMLVIGAGVANAGNGRYFFNKNGGTIEVSLTDWMKWIPDDTLISDISIPGTHDTAAVADGPTDNSVKTQQMSLREQLDAGIRALDIRARHEDKEDGKGARFYIYHGKYFQNDFCGDNAEDVCGDFGDVLRIVAGFLVAHPSETVLMRFGTDGVPSPKGKLTSSKTYEDTFRWYRKESPYGSYIWKPPAPGLADPDSFGNNPKMKNKNYHSQIPKLGEIRGKIFILQNFPIDSDAFYGMAWSFDNVEIQDLWELTTLIDIQEKKSDVAAFFVKTKLGMSDTLYVNFTSGAGGVFPQTVANGLSPTTGLNEFTLNYLFAAQQTRTTGLVMMDFPGAGLISAIVAHNFKFGSADDYKRDWIEAVGHVLFSAQGDDGGTANLRGRQVSNFVRHVTKDRFMHVVAYKDPGWADGTFDQLYIHKRDVNGLNYLVFGTNLNVFELDTQTTAFQDWMLADLEGLESNPISKFRHDTQFASVKNEFFGMHWALIVKGDDGGGENWFFDVPVNVRRIDAELFDFDDEEREKVVATFRHVLWNIAINNPPVADAGGPYEVDEGSSVWLDASGSTDPDNGSLTFRWDLENDGTWDTDFISTPSTLFNGIDDGIVTVKVEVSDEKFTDTDTAEVTVKNVAPIVSANNIQINENGTATVSGTIVDPGTQDTFSVTINWDDGSVPEVFAYGTGSTAFSEQHQYLDDNPTGTPSDDYNVTVTVEDDDGGIGVDTSTVTVDNVAPTVAPAVFQDETGSIIGVDVDFVLVGMAVNVETTFTDIGTLDTHVATVDWGDGSSNGAVVTQTPGGGKLTASHTWAAPINAAVIVTVTDDDTGSGTDERLVRVLDPIDALKETSKDVADLVNDPSLSKRTLNALKKLLGYMEGNNNGAAANGALDLLEKDNESAALAKIEDAVDTIDKLLLDPKLNDDQLALLNQMAKSLALTAKSVYVDLAKAAGAVASKQNDLRKLANAAILAADADSLLASGDVSGAVANWANAVQIIEPIVGH